MQIIDQLTKEKLIAVIRAENQEVGYNLSKAVMDGGFKAVEITFTVPDAESLIQRLSHKFKNALIGAGTVLDINMCKKAIEAGAQYIVSPGFDEETADYCFKQDIPYFPGCMTVTEMMKAIKHHVNVVKLFPGSHFAPSFIKNIKPPLPMIKVMVTGGVDLDNINEWLTNGADMIGIGSALTKHQGDYDKVAEVARMYKAQVKDVL